MATDFGTYSSGAAAIYYYDNYQGSISQGSGASITLRDMSLLHNYDAIEQETSATATIQYQCNMDVWSAFRMGRCSVGDEHKQEVIAFVAA